MTAMILKINAYSFSSLFSRSFFKAHFCNLDSKSKNVLRIFSDTFQIVDLSHACLCLKLQYISHLLHSFISSNHFLKVFICI